MADGLHSGCIVNIIGAQYKLPTGMEDANELYYFGLGMESGG